MFEKKDINEVPSDSELIIETKTITHTFSEMTAYKAKEYYDLVKKAIDSKMRYVELGNELICVEDILRMSLGESDSYTYEATYP